MENEIQANKKTLEIDSHELLLRFLLECKDSTSNNEFRKSIIHGADLVTAVFYYRRYPKVEDFIEKYIKGNYDYFLLQWIRSTWDTFSKMSENELSELVINQISTVANLEESP